MASKGFAPQPEKDKEAKAPADNGIDVSDSLEKETYYALTSEDVLETMKVLKWSEIKILYGLRIAAATGGNLIFEVKELADTYDMSSKTVRRVLKNLRELNYINFEETKGSVVISLPD